MLDVLILFLALVIFVISLFLYKSIAGKLFLPSFTSFFYFYYIIFAFIGSFLFVSKLCFPYLEDIFSVNNEVLLEQFFLVGGGLIVIGVVMFMVQKILRFSPRKEIESYFSKPLEKIVSPRESFFLPFFCISLFLGLILVGFILLPAIRQGFSLPVFSAFSSQVEYVKGRIMLVDILENRHWLIAGTMLLKLSTYISFIYAYLKKTWKWKILFVSFFILSLLIVLIPGTKIRIIFFFAELILIKFFLDFQKWVALRRSIRKLYFKYIALGLVIIVPLLFILFGLFTEKPFWVTKTILKRVFLSQIEGLYHILNLYPERLDFLYGRGFANPGGILSYEPIFVGEQIAEYLVPGAVEAKTFLGMNTIFSGDAYANFGWLGTILSIIIAGTIIQTMNILFIKYFKKNAITLSVYVILITEWLPAIFGDLNALVFWGTVDYYLLFIVAFIMYYFSKNLRQTYPKKQNL